MMTATTIIDYSSPLQSTISKIDQNYNLKNSNTISESGVLKGTLEKHQNLLKKIIYIYIYIYPTRLHEQHETQKF